jgi:ribosomal protein S24E
METISDKKNLLLKRREVKIIVKDKSNPGNEKAKELIGKNFKADSNQIAIKNLKSKFGRDTFLIDAFIYDTEQDKIMIEPKPKEKKK